MDFFHFACERPKKKKKTQIKTTVQVEWCKQADNWIKLNINGSSLGNSSLVNAGDIVEVKDHRGI